MTMRRTGCSNEPTTHSDRDWTLHDLRHSAAARMVRDPQLTLSDVQWVLGHAYLSTPDTGEVIAGVLAHHAHRTGSQQSGASTTGAHVIPATTDLATARRWFEEFEGEPGSTGSSPSR
jgi:hypothetical protein